MLWSQRNWAIGIYAVTLGTTLSWAGTGARIGAAAAAGARDSDLSLPGVELENNLCARREKSFSFA